MAPVDIDSVTEPPEPDPQVTESFPWVLVVVSVVAVGVICVSMGLLVYFKKRKH